MTAHILEYYNYDYTLTESDLDLIKAMKDKNPTEVERVLKNATELPIKVYFYFNIACKDKNINLIQTFLKDPRFDAAYDNSRGYLKAYFNHNDEVLKVLLNTPHYNNIVDGIIRASRHWKRSAEETKTKVIEIIIDGQNIEALQLLDAKGYDLTGNSRYLNMAIYLNDVDTVKYLSTLYKTRSLAVTPQIIEAVKTGNVELVKYLINEFVLDLSMRQNYAATIAIKNNDNDMFDYLMTDPNVQSVKDSSYFHLLRCAMNAINIYAINKLLDYDALNNSEYASALYYSVGDAAEEVQRAILNYYDMDSIEEFKSALKMML